MKKIELLPQTYDFCGREIADLDVADLEMERRSKQIIGARFTYQNASHGQKHVILDTETTGLKDAHIVEISMCDLRGNTVFDSLVKPDIPIPHDASEIHGIDDKTVANAPNLHDIWGDIKRIIEDCDVLFIYNAEYDIGVLEHCQLHYNLPVIEGLKEKAYCVMESYKFYVAEWSDHHCDYKWQRLNGGHRALGDCVATAKLLHTMAMTELPTYKVDSSPRFSIASVENRQADAIWINDPQIKDWQHCFDLSFNQSKGFSIPVTEQLWFQSPSQIKKLEKS